MDTLEMINYFGWLDRMFFFYLFITFCIVTASAFRLTRSVWTFRRHSVPLNGENHDAEMLAEEVLKGTLTAEADNKTDTPDRNSILSILDRIDAQFTYLSDVLKARVQLIKGLATLTVILSLVIVSKSIAIACAGIGIEEEVSVHAVGFAFETIFYMLAVGLLVTAYFYLVAGIFKHVLHRRRTDWNHMRAQFKHNPS